MVKLNLNFKKKDKKSKKAGGRQLARNFLIAGLVLLIASTGVWWVLVRNHPRRVFEAMLINNLRTSSVTRTIYQQSGLQTMEQTVHFQNQPSPVANSVTDLRQTGTVNANVRTETIGTPTTDYVRYLSIETDQASQDGQPLDYSDAENVWGVSETGDEQALAELYGDSALGVIPFGNLGKAERDNLLRLIKEENVYEINYDTVERFSEAGRQYYRYSVSVNPEAYITMLKQFAARVGLTQLEGIDPAQFSGSPALNFGITIDLLTQRLTSMTTATRDREETYSGYGVVKDVRLPEETISVEELQTRVQQVQ
jgi:hypothetical protein